MVLCGTKGTGDCWYGYGNGVEYPYLDVDDATVYPEIPDWPYNDRGFWSDGITAQLIFYSLDDLAGVAAGSTAPSAPQPYAVMTLDDYLFDGAAIDHVRAKATRRTAAAKRTPAARVKAAADPGAAASSARSFRAPTLSEF